MNVEDQTEVALETLESEVKKYADSLPYWAKYLGSQILSGKIITNTEIETAYTYLLEDLELKEKTTREDINLSYSTGNSTSYKSDLLLKKLENVEGVNALIENQVLEFCEFLTIIYGANGSGKSGYIRLLKQIFYSKSPEEILPNVHIEAGHKPVKAELIFSSGGSEIPLEYPAKKGAAEFEQYSIFDGKSVINQLEQKNEFDFRPAGLSFFSDFTSAIIQLEQRLQRDLNNKLQVNQFDLWFDGDSEIKTLIQNLSASTKSEDLKKYTPYSDKDVEEKAKIQKEYDELLLASAGKEKEIKSLENVKKLLAENEIAIEGLNNFFTNGRLKIVIDAISDLVQKEAVAKAEGVESFKTEQIIGIGTPEWKNFVISAAAFAQLQSNDPNTYPEDGDSCLLCHQPLSEDAQNLVANYWLFIKSIAEENAKKALDALNAIKDAFERLAFDLFPDDNTLTVWLAEKYPAELALFKQELGELKTLKEGIITDIQNKKINERTSIKIKTEFHTTVTEAIEKGIKVFQEGEENVALEKLQKSKTFLEHKEKFNAHLLKFEEYVANQIWIKKAGKASFGKRQITDTEKGLSHKYFNQKYVDTFNEECLKLNGNFDIKINTSGSAGKSYRQLMLKGRSPNAILSEGEQKVIAIADFLAEMQLSDVNRGIVFDDPVTSLDDHRKSEIALRLAQEAKTKQVVIFTHDLAFVSSLMGHCKDLDLTNDCHWVENIDGNSPGTVWLKNTPSYEKDYKTSGKAQAYLADAKKAAPELREEKLKNGFAALRTSYETLVVFGLFKGVVQRFEERVSVDSLKSVMFTAEIRDEVLDSFYQCCRYMEGHSHSDKYQYKKPTVENLQEEITRFDTIKSKVSKMKSDVEI